MRPLRVILFDVRVHDKWSYEQLPMDFHWVTPVLSTVEKTSTGVTPAELILNNSIRLSARNKPAEGCHRRQQQRLFTLRIIGGTVRYSQWDDLWMS